MRYNSRYISTHGSHRFLRLRCGERSGQRGSGCDSVLEIIDGVFSAEGWTVSSLQYDGMHVEHRTAMELRATMDNAVAVVKSQLGYDIELTEKSLFRHELADEALQQEAIYIARGAKTAMMSESTEVLPGGPTRGGTRATVGERGTLVVRACAGRVGVCPGN